MESTFHKIIRKTGRKPISCKCKACKSQCSKAPCLGTPEDIEKIIDAGYAKRIFSTSWLAGINMGITNKSIDMFQPEQLETGCTFFKDGLCELHDKGLKPTEGRLSHHTHTPETFTKSKSLSWNVAKEWENPENAETINRIKEKLSMSNSIIQAPFTDDQVEKLKKYQENGIMHPFTCCSPENISDCQRKNGTSDGHLIPSNEGWICPCGQYKQNWCYDLMLKDLSFENF